MIGGNFGFVAMELQASGRLKPTSRHGPSHLVTCYESLVDACVFRPGRVDLEEAECAPALPLPRPAAALLGISWCRVGQFLGERPRAIGPWARGPQANRPMLRSQAHAHMRKRTHGTRAHSPMGPQANKANKAMSPQAHEPTRLWARGLRPTKTATPTGRTLEWVCQAESPV